VRWIYPGPDPQRGAHAVSQRSCYRSAWRALRVVGCVRTSRSLAARASSAQLQHVWCAALYGMLSSGARRAPQIIMSTTSCTTHHTWPPRGCWAGPGRPVQRQLLLLLLNGGCCCSCSTMVAAAAAAGSGRAAQRQLLMLLLLLCSTAAAGASAALLLLPGRAGLGQAGPGRAAQSEQQQQIAVACGAWCNWWCAYLRRPPRATRKHTVQCSAPLVLQLRATSRCSEACALCGHNPRPAAHATRCGNSSSGLQRGLCAGVRRRVYPARGARYKCTCTKYNRFFTAIGC
jgi:hypothetical protein